MQRKRNEKEKSLGTGNGSKDGFTKKRNVRSGREAALVPAPKGLADILELVNLLPIHLRHPYWARREQHLPEKSKFRLLEETVLNWRFGEESRLAGFAAELGEAVPEEVRTNTPSLLWVTLRSAMRELPLALQAFLLHDEQGNEVEVDGQLVPVGIPPDLQSWRNLSVIRKPQHELDRIIKEASTRIHKSIEEELAGERVPQIPDFDHPEGLLERSRHRLMLVLGVQELFSYLMNPDRRDDLFFAATYYQSDAARSHFYVDKVGKIVFTPPPIVGFLEGTEAARIRECSVCFKFFWAGRKDMRCCSTKCANTGRMREFRKRFYTKPTNANVD